MAAVRAIFEEARIPLSDSMALTYLDWDVKYETLRVAIDTAVDEGAYSSRFVTHLVKQVRSGRRDIRSGMPWNAREDQAIHEALDGVLPVLVLAWAVHGGGRWNGLVSGLFRRSNAVASRAERLMGWPEGYLRGFRDIAGKRIDRLDPATMTDLAIIAEREVVPKNPAPRAEKSGTQPLHAARHRHSSQRWSDSP